LTIGCNNLTENRRRNAVKKKMRKLALQGDRIRELTIHDLPVVGGVQPAHPSRILFAADSDFCGVGGSGATH
jgi:hypothetical protein